MFRPPDNGLVAGGSPNEKPSRQVREISVPFNQSRFGIILPNGRRANAAKVRDYQGEKK
jgi:hypothetical protein